ncbi:MAG: histidine kinase [Proteobacteria bacterium]|nr:histidine kinase [Pseudomonadota bacterium]
MEPHSDPAGALFSTITVRAVLITLGVAFVGAVALNPIFAPPFSVVLGRLLVISMLLLIAFRSAAVWHPRGVPRWLAQVLAVVLAAPLATFIVYLPSVGGNAAEVLRNEGRVMGFIFITVLVLILAPVLAMGALYRERDAQARNDRLRFELERSTLEKQALDARLRLLHAQIEPHFLFNTLSNVQALVESGSAQAAPVLKSLTAYLRAAMPQLDGDAATLGSEARLVRAYLDLMHMRMPDRLRHAVDIAPELGPERFPSMALLTLVENAVQHGIDPSEQGGSIDVRAWRDGAMVRVAVTDTGVGISETATPGTGLANLRTRLTAFYGPDAGVALSEVQPHGVRAELYFRPA